MYFHVYQPNACIQGALPQTGGAVKSLVRQRHAKSAALNYVYVVYILYILPLKIIQWHTHFASSFTRLKRGRGIHSILNGSLSDL